MNEAAAKRYQEKETRIRKAVALEEPDRVPITVNGAIYAIMQTGHTVAEANYDTTLEIAKNASVWYMNKYDPDIDPGMLDTAGQGPINDLIGLKYMDYAGRPGTKIDKNSIQQFLEFPVLLDDEFEEFFTDRTGWKMKKAMPRLTKVCQSMDQIDIPLSHFGKLSSLISSLSTPDVRKMITTLWEVRDMNDALARARTKANAEIAELGFPSFPGGHASVPFDMYSDVLRGTLLSLMDLNLNDEYVQRFIDEVQPQILEQVRNANRDGSHTGGFVRMMLHKGLDGFMSDEYYVKYYWKYLQEIIQTIVDCGMVPYIFYEGRYSSRLAHLGDIPKGKVIYRFEDTPMDLVKKTLGDVACITGGFSNVTLDFGTKQQVIDECKKMIDDCAPGGGFIFHTKSALTYSKPENVEAMFQTVRDYGKY